MFDAMRGVLKGSEYEEVKWVSDPSRFVEYRNGQNENVLTDENEPGWLAVGALSVALAAKQKMQAAELYSLHQPQPMNEVLADEIWRDMLVPDQEYLLELYN